MDALQHGVEVARRHLKVHLDDPRAWCLGAMGLIDTGDVDIGLGWAGTVLSVIPNNRLLQYELCTSGHHRSVIVGLRHDVRPAVEIT